MRMKAQLHMMINVCLQFARSRHPERVVRIVLANTSYLMEVTIYLRIGY
jgi:hypothetical protein